MKAYQQAQEGIAQILSQWKEDIRIMIASGSKISAESPQTKAAAVLSLLFTPEQIEEWKKGGYPAIVCNDQSLPEPIENKYLGSITVMSTEDMKANFRRVKGGEG